MCIKRYSSCGRDPLKTQTAKYGTFDEISLVRGRPGWCGFGADFAEVVRIWSGAVRIWSGTVRKWRVAAGGADIGNKEPNPRRER